MINQIKEIFNTILNKEGRGELTPPEFDGLLHTVQMDIFNKYLEELRKHTRLNNRGFGFNGLSNAKAETLAKLNKFKIRKSIPSLESVIEQPKEFAFLDSNAITVNHVLVTVLDDDNKRFLKSKRTQPSDTMPVCEMYDNKIEFYPSFQLRKTVRLEGIRFPKSPKWTFREIGNSYLFNPSAPDFQDVELHESELPNIIWGLCSLAGVRLKDIEITQVMESLKDKDFQKTNMN